jgi:hypothetical protein
MLANFGIGTLARFIPAPGVRRPANVSSCRNGGVYRAGKRRDFRRGRLAEVLVFAVSEA